MSSTSFKIAEKNDAPIIFAMLTRMAKDLGKEHEFKGSLDSLEKMGFTDQPAFEAIIAWRGNEAVGFILYFYEYSTWTARCGMYVQDLYVDAEHRGKGLAARIVSAAVKQGEVDKGASYMELAVHKDNHTGFGFYRAMGFETVEGEMVMKLDGDAFQRAQGK